MAEADKLIDEIDAMVIEDIRDTQGIEFEKRCQALKKCRSNLRQKMTEEDVPEGSSTYAEGFHQANQEIERYPSGERLDAHAF